MKGGRIVATRKADQSGPNKGSVALLIAVIVVAVGVAAYFGSGLVGSIKAENSNFEPTPDVLKQLSVPGYTPYGQDPKPGEIRPGLHARGRGDK